MVFNTTFNNISVISWQSVLLVEENGKPGENYRSVASHGQSLSHNVVSSTSRHVEIMMTATNQLQYIYMCSRIMDLLCQEMTC